MARLTARERAALPDRAFAYIDSSGRRRLPIYDASHVRNALSRYNQVVFESDAQAERARRRLLAAAKRFRIVPIGFIDSQIRAAAEPSARRLPDGFVTMLLSDIEGSTGHLARLGDAYGDLLVSVRNAHGAAVSRVGGVVVEERADEYFAVFESPPAAIAAAAAIHRSVNDLDAGGEPVSVRIGIHAGYPTRRLDNYVGMAVHVAARISAAAHGGQTVTSGDTIAAVGDNLPDGVVVTALGRYRLRGIPGDPLQLFQVDADDAPLEFPPVRV